MPENILVVEYEPRYTDRVRQALAGQPFEALFAKDGEEAMRALDSGHPRLIVLSSVVPKISTPELIRAIRGRKPTQETPILLTVSGYSGKSPKQDAQRMGASDILPKPYSETEFLGKVQQMLGVRAAGLTSNEIFGDLFDDERAVVSGARKPMKSTDDVDKMLADTLAGVMPQKKKDAAPAAAPKPAAPPTPPPAAAPPTSPPPAGEAKRQNPNSSADLDRMLADTLSGLEKKQKPVPASEQPTQAIPRSSIPTPPTAAGAKPRFNTERLPAYVPDRVPVSQPVIAPAPAPAAPAHEEEEPKDGIKFGQYVLLEKIATGGMAEVWKARMRGVEGFQKIVAIKKILPHLSDNQDFIEMFIDEAKLAAQLNHNNIIHIYDLGKIQSSYYIAMEYIDGYDLKTILKKAADRDHPISVELALFIAAKIAAALDYAHRKRDFEDRDMGLVHRDVSPQNVLISEEGDIKLCDFGIAKAASKASHTQAGALKGKLQYMSPEQAWGRSIDKRSDIFALAAVLFEMLTGRKLFTGDNELSILEQVREARVSKPSELNDEVTPEIDAIVLKALQKDPDRRYQTAGEMARELDQILYSFKPTPTSADLAIFMHRLSTPEPVRHEPEPAPAPPPPPVVEKPKPAPVAAPLAAAAAAAPAVAAHAPAHAHVEPHVAAAVPAAKKSSSMGIFIVLGILLLAGGAIAFVLTRGKSDPAAPAAATQTSAAPATVPAGTTTQPPALVPPNASIAPAATGTAIDPSRVNEEVARRIAAERARLEQQARLAQQQTATQAPVARPTPAVPTPIAPQPPVVAVPPPVAAPQPQPPPAAVVPTPTPAVPEPQPTAPQRAREGDLVAAGTEGLTPARMIKKANVPYPPLARAQRVEGTVIMSVLISETGQVIETRMLRGVNRPVGLNEAAELTVRRSSFSPATKDGVRVRMWLTVPVEFRL